MVKSLIRGSFVLVLVIAANSVASAQTIGSAMVTFLQGKVGTRVGAGECANMATEALRVSGGEFIPADLGADSPGTGDLVWGTLITTISYSTKVTDSNPTNLCQAGDIIQYGGGAKMGTTSFPTHHTSVITAVNSSGRPTSIYQQNFNKVRTVQSATIDVTKLTAGWLRIYRPKSRTDTSNKWKFTVVNNATTSQSYSLMVGTTNAGSVSLTAANSAGAFRISAISTTGTVPCILLSNSQSIYLTNAKGFEIYNPTSTTIGIRQLSQ